MSQQTSPDVFLSHLNPPIRYDNMGLKGTPAEIVANLVALTAAYDANSYETKDFVTAPLTSAAFDPHNVSELSKRMMAYFDALATGDLKAVHHAVDQVNHLRMKMGGQELVPPPDFEIIAHQHESPEGIAARWIISQYADKGSYEDFFATYGDAIRQYARETGKQHK